MRQGTEIFDEWLANGVRLSPSECLIVAATEHGQTVSHERLKHLLWGHDPEGGPENMTLILRMHAYRLRQKGYPLHSFIGHGYKLMES